MAPTTFLFLFILLSPSLIHAESSTSLHVALSSGWSFTSLFNEAIEFFASESPNQLWHFVRELGETQSKEQRMSDQDAISQLLKVGEKYLSNQQSHLMEMSFSVRSYSPRVAMHYQVAEQSWKLAQKSSDCPENQSENWVLDVNTNQAICSLNDLKAFSLPVDDAGDCIVEESDEMIWLPDGLENVFPNNQTKPSFVLYGDIESPLFVPFFDQLKQKDVPFAFRYNTKEDPSEQRFVYLQGYGVRLDLKNMEYKAIDDTQQEGREEEEEENEEIESNEIASIDKDEETHGFYFGVLYERFPDSRESLSLLRENLKELDISPDESVEYYQTLKPWDLKKLPLRASHRVLKSPDPLNSIIDITQNLPSHALAISKIRETKETRKEIQQMWKDSPVMSGQSALVLNGQLLRANTLDPFQLFSALQTEFKKVDLMSRFGFGSEMQRRLLLEPKTAPTFRNVRFDVRSKAVQFLNSLSEYSRIPSSLSVLDELEEDSIVYSQRNLVTLVIAGDPTAESFSAIIQKLNFRRGIPFRVGVALWSSSEDGQFLSTAFHYFESHYGKMQAIYALAQFSQLSGDSLDFALMQNGMNREIIFNWAATTSKVRKLQRATQNFVSQIGVNEPGSLAVFVNGIPILTTESHSEKIYDVAHDEFALLKQLYLEGKITDDLPVENGIYSYLLGRKDLPKEVPSFFWNQKRAFPNVLGNLGESLWGNPTYVSSPKHQNSIYQITYALIGDFTTALTLRIVRDLLDATSICSPPPILKSAQDVITSYGCLEPSSVSSRILFLSTEDAPIESTLITDSIYVAFETQTPEKSMTFARVLLSNLLESRSDLIANKDSLQVIIQDALSNSQIDSIEFETFFAKKRPNEEREMEFVASLDLPSKEGALFASPGIFLPLTDELTLATLRLVHQLGVDTSQPLYDRLLDSIDADKEKHSVEQLNSQFLLTSLYSNIYGTEDLVLTPESAISIPSLLSHGSDDSVHTICAVVNPISPEGQKVVKFVNWIRSFDPKISTYLLLNPDHSLEELPTKSYYQYVLQPLQFDDEGLISRQNGATFDDLPDQRLLTVEMEASNSWLVQPIHAAYDLDNLKLVDVKEKQVFAEYQVISLLYEGQCSDAKMGPPQGLQLYLGDKINEHVHDTTVMLQYGYYQLQANPGVWELSFAEGKARLAFDFIENEERYETRRAVVSDYNGGFNFLSVAKKPGMESVSLLTSEDDGESQQDVTAFFSSLFKGKPPADVSNETIHVFSVASGHLYERFLKIMILSVMKNTNNPVKFWFIANFLSPQIKEALPILAEKFSFEFELVTYQWPWWLNEQTEKQRRIWGYKILFLDVLFPLNVNKVIFVDADQIVRADLAELIQIDLEGAVYGFVPFCDSRPEMDGFRFWKGGFWESHLGDLPYHISALFVVDLERFRSLAAGDRLRATYNGLSQDKNSLANLDQDLPNYMQRSSLRIFSLPQDWLWCETWCSDTSKKTAKTIDLCNNPLTKAPKLQNAVRIVEEWTALDEEARLGGLLEE